jgi:DUF4097 and DUF4098 domain-containing protein YvlB
MTTLLLLATISIWHMGGDIDIADAPNGAWLYTMGGDIRITRGAGNIIAKTMGGNIDIRSLTGSAEAGTMGGRIRVVVDGRGPGHDLDLHSLGGEVELTLPADFDGTFDLELEEGDTHCDLHVISDFPLSVRESKRVRFFGSNHYVQTATGRTGAGTNHVRITTVGSDITIRKK